MMKQMTPCGNQEADYHLQGIFQKWFAIFLFVKHFWALKFGAANLNELNHLK